MNLNNERKNGVQKVPHFSDELKHGGFHHTGKKKKKKGTLVLCDLSFVDSCPNMTHQVQSKFPLR